MGKRIKLIYILSLFSALMAISVQAYWLYNQYRYEVERYADEIAADVLRVGDEAVSYTHLTLPTNSLV